MKQRLNLQIALGLLRARLRQSIVAGAGVTFGIGLFITLNGFMSGLNQMLDGLILNRTAHVRIYNEIRPSDEQPVERAEKYSGAQHFIHSVQPRNRDSELYDVRRILDKLNDDKRVLGIAPRIMTQVFFNAGVIEIAGVINGVDIQQEDRLFGFSDNVVDGEPAQLSRMSNSIFIGKGLANKLMVGRGDMVQVTTATGGLASLRVIGTFQIGLADIDDKQVYASLETTQKLLGKSSGFITDLHIKLHDLNIAPQVAREYEKLFDVDAMDIQTANAQFETGSDVRTTISFAVGITLLIVAGFGIYNILNMLIYEKMDSIAILKATGFKGSDVKSIFISLSMIIGFAGGFIGLIFGYLLSMLVDTIPFANTALPKMTTFPVYYNPRIYLIGISFALITTYVAGLFPARKAAKVDPVVIIRGK